MSDDEPKDQPADDSEQESDKPADDSDKPADESDKPADDSDKPADDSDKPADDSDKPADDSDKPADESDKSADESDKPADESDKPADESDKPADDSDKPADDSEKPADESEKPADESDKPADDSDKPTEQKSDSAFDDSDDLGNFLKDQKAADTLTVSSVADAKSKIAAFRSSSATSPWKSLSREKVADGLDQLIDNPRSVQQDSLNLCGPAAFFSQWIKRDPVAFAKFATSLFDTGSGQIGSFKVTPKTDLVNASYSDMHQKMGVPDCPQADWMILGALRNSSDVFWSFTGDPKQQVAGMTFPADITNWFKATGIYTVDNKANLATSAGIPAALDLKVSEGVDTALLINVNLMAKGEPLGEDGKPLPVNQDKNWILKQFPNHWVVLLNEIVQEENKEHPDSRAILLNIWSWGKTYRLRVQQADFVDNFYGAVIARLQSK